ncbi:hypothetical protein [Maridesulfovibrio sp.]|uniref:hypothetical protein n=1 Tax=Maridesulfovibrio sp. TaxID=2795000 RepID=UPI0029CA9407|nr:hypothetical protein [Maridesulfovibrio sp.]
MKDYVSYVAAISSFLTIVSFAIIIIQHLTRKQEIAALKSQVQENFNAYFLIARACTRGRSDKQNVVDVAMTCELEYIRGVCDTQRNGIIAYGREHLSFVPFYEHPMFPGEKQPDEVMAGMPPDQFECKGSSKIKESKQPASDLLPPKK